MTPDQEFLHAFVDGAEPGWDASVRYDAHEKVRKLFEQLEAAERRLARFDEILARPSSEWHDALIRPGRIRKKKGMAGGI